MVRGPATKRAPARRGAAKPAPPKRKYVRTAARATAAPKTKRTPAQKREYDRLRKRVQRKNEKEGTPNPVGPPRKVSKEGEAVSMGAVGVITRSRLQVTLAGVVLMIKAMTSHTPSHPPHPPAGGDGR